MSAASQTNRHIDAPFVFRVEDAMGWDGKLLQRAYGNAAIATVTRNALKRVVDDSGLLTRSPRGLPAITRVSGHRVVLVEPQHFNLCVRSQEMNTTWGWQAGATPTADTTTAPDGTLTADTVTGGGGSESGIYIVPTFTGNGEKAFALYLKAGTSTRTDILIYDTIVPITRVRCIVTWSGGVPTLSNGGGAGTLFPVEALANGWYRILFTATGVVAANATRIYIYPHNLSPYTGTVYVWGVQAQNALFPSSYIPTTTVSADRSADALTFNLGVQHLSTRAPLTLYVRFVERDGMLMVNGELIGFHDTNGQSRFHIQYVGGAYAAYHTGATAAVAAAGVGVPTPGQLVEVRALLYADGSVQCGISIEGGAEGVGSASAAISGGFNANNIDRMRVGKANSEAQRPIVALSHVVWQDGIKTMDEMRALARVI